MEVRVDPKVPVVHLAHEVPLDRRENKVLLVLPARRVPREIKERTATEVTLEIGAHLDLKETLATMDLQDLLDNEARRLVATDI